MWRRSLDLNPDTCEGAFAEINSRVFLLSDPHSTADHDGRDGVPPVLTLLFYGEIVIEALKKGELAIRRFVILYECSFFDHAM